MTVSLATVEAITEITDSTFTVHEMGEKKRIRFEDVRSLRVYRDGATGPLIRLVLRVLEANQPAIDLSTSERGIDAKKLNAMLGRIAQSLTNQIRERLAAGREFGSADWTLSATHFTDNVTHESICLEDLGAVTWLANRVAVETASHPFRYDTTEDNNWLLVPALDAIRPTASAQATTPAPQPVASNNSSSATPTVARQKPAQPQLPPVAAARLQARKNIRAEVFKFDATVTSEPNFGTKPTVCKCQLTAKGIRISLPDQVVNLPVGTTAYYDGNSSVSFTLLDRTLRLSPSSFWRYSQRMSKDVAVFVTHGGELPRQSAYDLDWYIWAVAALPLLISLAFLNASLVFGGLCTSCSCLWIFRKESWPSLLRAVIVGFLIVMFAAGAYLTAAGFDIEQYQDQRRQRALEVLRTL